MMIIIIIMILICHVYLYSTKYSHKYLLVHGLGLLVFKKSVFITSSSSSNYHCDKMLSVSFTVGLISPVQ